MRIRLDKYLAEAGKGTRSEVKKLIAAGRVSVDGIPVKDPGWKVSPVDSECGDSGREEQVVCIDGHPVHYAAFEYYLLNKPQGVISASRDEAHGMVCVTDLIEEKIRKDLFPVGRLDRDTEGLLLITNDGELCHRLLSPKNHVDKTYYAGLDGPLTEEMIRRLEEGVDIGDEAITLPCRIEVLPPGGQGPESSEAKVCCQEPSSGTSFHSEHSSAGAHRPEPPAGASFCSQHSALEACRPEPRVHPLSPGSACRITIHEGRYHQIRRMFETQGRKVTFLKRLSMGPLVLDDALEPGQYRRLTEEERSALKIIPGKEDRPE